MVLGQIHPDTQTCFALLCDKPIRADKIFCERHWGMVPRGVKVQIVEHYRTGQFLHGQVKPEWLHAVKDAMLFTKEGLRV